jgi:SAM-dependent methyltransferase
LVEDALAGRGRCAILDAGGALPYWRACAPDLLDDPRIELHLLNLSAGDACGGAEPAPSVRAVIGDARDLRRYPDGAFDLVHANSVIEHVGRWTDMAAMAAEVRRVGRRYLVQTPYWGFPLEPHFRAPFFHWLPEAWRARLLLRFDLGFARRAANWDAAMRRVQSAVLLDRAQFAALFHGANIHSEIAWGLTKSLLAVGGEGIAPHPASNTRRLLASP